MVNILADLKVVQLLVDKREAVEINERNQYVFARAKATSLSYQLFMW